MFYQDPPTEAMARHSDPMPSKIGRMLTALEGHPLPTLPIAVESDVSIKSGIDVDRRSSRAALPQGASNYRTRRATKLFMRISKAK